MSYAIPPHRLEPIREVLAALSQPDAVVLTTHINADGDGAGSEVALAAWLRASGKEVWIINPTPFPEGFRFLLPDPQWCLDPGSPRAREAAAAADAVVVLDTSEIPRVGRVWGLVGELPKVVVDHHPPGPDPIPGVCFRDPEAAATGELLFDLLRVSGGELLPEAALGLYVAILTDTGSFRFSNASPRAHRIVAELLEVGVDPEGTHRKVYGDYPLRRFQLLQASLEELEVDPLGDLAWMTVPREAYDALSATTDDLDGLVDYPREIKGVAVGILFRETARGGTKVSLRSNGDVDVNAIARRFGGGGHAKAAGAMVERPLAEVRKEVLEATRNAIR
ncbi:MAG: DHH family phosphoesterase, partial [Longimicrobiales bacterium]